MGRGAGDVLDPLILVVVIEANLAIVNQDPDLQRAYAGLETAPPDHLRRPVSISAVAASLNLPYETVRRRVSQLSANGACAVTSRGVLVPAALLTGPFYTITAVARYERLKRFYFELKAMGVLGGMAELAAQAQPFDSAPVRLVNRALAEYMLRVVENILKRLGHPLTGLILLEMARANSEHLEDDDKQIEGPIPDDMRRPIPTLALARRLGLPAETVRRHVRSLQRGGYCQRRRGGLLAALEQLGREEGGPGLSANLMNVMRLFNRLATHGVLAQWDRETAEADRSRDEIPGFKSPRPR